MSITKVKESTKLMLNNVAQFLFTLAFVFSFQTIFGAENVLVAVAISVGLTMLPFHELGIRPWTMVLIINVLYNGSAFIAQSALLSPYLAVLLNFAFVAFIFLLTNEPALMKPSISFILCFVFAQSTPVPWEHLPMRFACTITGSLLISIVLLIVWKKKGIGKDGRNVKEQIKAGTKEQSYLLRMAFGISIAMFIGMIFHVQKPLWISIVVMSLTQIELSDTITRIKHRFLGNMVGILCFLLFFEYLIPREYAMIAILALGYINYFITEYKHKQIINAINAINASLVLLDTASAFSSRLLCFFCGVVIVLVIYIFTNLIKACKLHYDHGQHSLKEYVVYMMEYSFQGILHHFKHS